MMSKTRNEIIQKRGYGKFINADELSLEIASYPITAQYLAKRLSKSGKTVCELCCGVGISLIEFSPYFERVIGVDNDPRIVEDARKNMSQAAIENCELIVGDVRDEAVIINIDTDIVVYDIPYWSDHNGTVDTKNPELKKIVSLIQANITKDVVIYAPPHMNYESVVKLFDDFEYQQIWINDRHDRNFIFLGSLIERSGSTKLQLK